MSTLERLRQMLAPYETRHVPGAAVPSWRVDIEGVPVQISIVPEPGHPRVRFEVSLPPWRRDLLVVAAEHALVSPPRLLSGDASFDAKVVVCDNDTHVLGCFDAPTRALVADLTACGGFVSGGVMVYSAPLELALDRILALLLAIGRRLILSEVATNRELDDIACNDPVAGVRARHSSFTTQGDADGTAGSDAVLDYLTTRIRDASLSPDMRADALDRLFAGFPLVRLEIALRAAPADLVEAIADRLCAAIAQRPARAGDDVAGQLVVHFARVLAHDAARLHRLVSAFVVLARAGLEPSLVYLGWLSGLVICESELLFALVTRALCALGATSGFEALGRVQSRVIPLLPKLAQDHPEIGAAMLLYFFRRINPTDEKRQIAYVQAIAATGDTSVEMELAELIDAQSYDVRLEILNALGAIGTLAVVPTLKPYSEGWLRDGSVKEAAKSALAAIRERANATPLPGALSLADDIAGALALDDRDD